jgi:gamma-glutamyltranspeptidase/glutathione hydrolase
MRQLEPAPVSPPARAVGEGANTTHFSIIDHAGNRVAATLSLNTPFGSGFMPPGTGVVLNNEMDDFSVAPGIPNAYGLVGGEANAIAPGKRPLSSMTPTFLETDDAIVVLGTPGGSRIISMVLLATLELAHGRGGPKEWVSLPRFHHQYLPDAVTHEARAFDADEARALQGFGHRLDVVRGSYGNMQLVAWYKKAGRLEAASDPRGEGSARVK